MRFRAISVAAIAGLTWASVALAAGNGSSATAYGGAAGHGIDGVVNFAQARARAVMYYTADGEGVFRAAPL